MDDSIHEKIKIQLTDYTSEDVKHMSNDDLQSSGKSFQKINIYNKNKKIPLQKIWLLTPKVKIFKQIFVNSNQKSSMPLTIVLGPTVGDIKKFYMFIKKLETHIDGIIKDLMVKRLKAKSSIRSASGFPPIMNLKMPCMKLGDGCYEFKFQIYNHLHKRVSLKTIDQGIYARAYIELSCVWINDNEYGFNWNILQLKLYPEFDFTKCLFTDAISIDDSDKPPEECYHCMYCPNAHVRTHMCVSSVPYQSLSMMAPPPPPPPPPPMPVSIPKSIMGESINKTQNKAKTVDLPKGFALSINDLLSIKLKPVNKNSTDNGSDQKNNEEAIMTDIKNKLKSNPI